MPKVKRLVYCQVCNEKLEDVGPNAKYCGDACRKQAERDRAENREVLKNASLTPEEIMEGARRLAGSPAFEDEVREVMREEVRRSIDQYARDRVLGFVEGMVGMLPMALVQINRDLNSESWPERKTAYAILTKYLMPMATMGDDKGAGQNNLVIQIGESPTAQEAFEAEVEDAEYAVLPTGVERFEATWPVCSGCGKRAHPDNVIEQATAKYCRSCMARQEYSGDKMPVEGSLSGRGRHADLLG